MSISFQRTDLPQFTMLREEPPEPTSMPSSARVYLVPPHEIQAHWPLALPFVKRSLEYQSDHDDVSVYRNLIAGEMRLWLVYEPGANVKAAVITRNVNFPLTRVCLIFGLGGNDMEEWIHFLPEVVEPWAKSQGCNFIELRGRDGWERLLGWRKTSVVLRKEL